MNFFLITFLIAWYLLIVIFSVRTILIAKNKLFISKNELSKVFSIFSNKRRIYYLLNFEKNNIARADISTMLKFRNYARFFGFSFPLILLFVILNINKVNP